MKSYLLLIIFLIIWFGIGGYLFMIDRQLKRIKQKLYFQQEEKDQSK